VIAESAIDALSYAALFPDERARYASLGGKPTPRQKELVRSAAAVMAEQSVIIAATDADQAGAEIAETIKAAVELTGRTDLRFERHAPDGTKDWNDVLRARPKSPLPFAAEKLSAG
jgi:DNA primase